MSGDKKDRQPLDYLPRVQVRPHPGLLHPPDLHPTHHHCHELLGMFPFTKSLDSFSVSLSLSGWDWENLKASVLTLSHQVSFWLIKTDMGHETAARTGLGATSTLAVVTIGFGGKTKPQVTLIVTTAFKIIIIIIFIRWRMRPLWTSSS